jgi:hypothetical protein
MNPSKNNALNYYIEQGMITNPGDMSGLFKDLPADIQNLCRVIQGIILHTHWTRAYGEIPSEDRLVDVNIRYVERILTKIKMINGQPLIQSRPPAERLIGNCRTYSTLLTSMLREQGIPARARCGFGKYFKKGWHEDHWVCEYWSKGQNRWILVDSQLDDLQCQELKINFDPLDVPRDQFITAGKAWISSRKGETDPNNYGIFDMHGMWFIRGNLIRDIAALNKIELLPWDVWGLIEPDAESITTSEYKLLDDIATMTIDEIDQHKLQKAFDNNDGLKVPAIIKSYTKSGFIKVNLTTENIISAK